MRRRANRNTTCSPVERTPVRPGHRLGGVAGFAGLFADEALFDLLTLIWRTDTPLADGQEETVLACLHALAADLTRPAGDTGVGGVAENGTAPTDDADEAFDEGVPLVAKGGEAAARLLDSDPRVRALGCLLEYGAHRTRTDGEMPAEVLDAVAGALAGRGDQNAVATAVGVRLPVLHHHAPAFAAAHRTALYGLVPRSPSPAASWLRWGPHDPQVLAALQRDELLAALQDTDAGVAYGAAAHTAAALLADPELLGDPAAFWAELAAGTGGVEAAVLLLDAIASRTPRADVPDGPDASGRLAAAAGLWRAALAAGLPPGALAGAGAFADAGLDDVLWLELMRASAEHTPKLTDADLVAERAVAHPESADALLLAATLVTHAPGTWQETAVRRHARVLLDAAMALPEAERPAAVEELRTVLINAGDLDAARR